MRQAADTTGAAGVTLTGDALPSVRQPAANDDSRPAGVMPHSDLLALFGHLRHGLPLDPGARARVANALCTYLDRRAPTIEHALGLSQAGREAWWRQELRHERDDALRDLAARFLPGWTIARQADEIQRLSRRYETGAWRHDVRETAMPDHYRGTVKEALYRAFRAMPGTLSARHLRRLLARPPVKLLAMKPPLFMASPDAHLPAIGRQTALTGNGAPA